VNIFKFFSRRNKQPEAPKAKEFSYKYLSTPFDTRWQHFSVSAMNQEEANALAVAEFQKIFDDGKTVMTNFYPE
jgi:hypothetical protein